MLLSRTEYMWALNLSRCPNFGEKALQISDQKKLKLSLFRTAEDRDYSVMRLELKFILA